MNQKPQNSPFPLRLEPELSEWVKDQARQGYRSINAELNRLVREAKEGAGKRDRK